MCFREESKNPKNLAVIEEKMSNPQKSNQEYRCFCLRHKWRILDLVGLKLKHEDLDNLWKDFEHV